MFDRLDTPSALIDVDRMQRNIRRMQARMDALGVHFRPHVKTAKCVEVARAQLAAGARGITVSTLKEARQFFASGFTDILYAVGLAPGRLPEVLDLRRRGCDLKVIADTVEVAREIGGAARQSGVPLEMWIEVDTDGHRSGIAPASALLLDVGRAAVEAGATLGGVLTHAGSSYDLDRREALEALAEQERAGCVLAAERLRGEGWPCPNVSVGSTPTALSAAALPGVTEVRAGVYVFFDLVMSNVGVCTTDDIALSVLTTVIGHQPAKGWAIVDAGWMAMSRDRGTQKQSRDYGYGQVCTESGEVIPGCVITGANQEHGIVSCAAVDDIVRRFPIGTRLRILPNHACATGAQFTEYHAVSATDATRAWPRFHGW